jgi:hypothetical protein
MASSGERRLLFDTRGKRKHVIRVVYAILALLMGASLFLVVGPVNIGALIGNSSSGGSAATVFHEQAERIEGRLAKNPGDEQLLLSLTRARINAGNAQIEPVAETEVPTVSKEAKEDFEAASESWSRYLKQTDEPSATAAQLVAGTSFRLAESSTSLLEAEEYVSQATRAQEIAAEQSPSLGSLSTLAIYQYFNSEFAAGDKTTKRAAGEASAKAEAKNIEKQLAEYRKRGKAFAKQKKELAKVQKRVNKEKLENPLGGGLGGSAAPLGE